MLVLHMYILTQIRTLQAITHTYVHNTPYVHTLSLEWILFFDGDEFSQHTAKPLWVDEVQITQETAVLVVEENPTVM